MIKFPRKLIRKSPEFTYFVWVEFGSKQIGANDTFCKEGIKFPIPPFIGMEIALDDNRVEFIIERVVVDFHTRYIDVFTKEVDLQTAESQIRLRDFFTANSWSKG